MLTPETVQALAALAALRHEHAHLADYPDPTERPGVTNWLTLLAYTGLPGRLCSEPDHRLLQHKNIIDWYRASAGQGFVSHSPGEPVMLLPEGGRFLAAHPAASALLAASLAWLAERLPTMNYRRLALYVELATAWCTLQAADRQPAATLAVALWQLPRGLTSTLLDTDHAAICWQNLHRLHAEFQAWLTPQLPPA